MRVYRLLIFLILALAFWISFVLEPAAATSEHPWSEDPYWVDSGGSCIDNSSGTGGGSEISSDAGSYGLGSDLWWISLIANGSATDEETNPGVDNDGAATSQE